jgi:hypothetical protein
LTRTVIVPALAAPADRRPHHLAVCLSGRAISFPGDQQVDCWCDRIIKLIVM